MFHIRLVRDRWRPGADRVVGRRVRTFVAIALATLMAIMGSLVRSAPANAAGGSTHCGTAVYGAIEDKYLQLGAEGGGLGCPTNLESDANGGRWQAFQAGYIFWNPDPAIWAHAVWGSIGVKWTDYGREVGILGYPLTDETVTPDGIGRYNQFQHGSIYWSAQTGTHVVAGSIRDKWASTSWERGILGYPVSDELGTPDGIGRYSLFQYGSIYWTGQTGAHLIYGSIRDKWASLGAEHGALGYPTTDEQGTPGVSRNQSFQHGSISWTPSTIAYMTPTEFHLDAPSITFNNGVPVGGWAHLVVFSNGAYNFSGHFHDSGATSYDTGVVWALRSAAGTAFVFSDPGHVAGTFESGSRDHDWNASGLNPALAASWASIQQGYSWQVREQTSLNLAGMLNEIKTVIGYVATVVMVVGWL